MSANAAGLRGRDGDTSPGAGTRRKRTLSVLLATLNGSRFLAEQLDSIFAQTFADFDVIVRDDGSSDETLDIVEAFRRRYRDRIWILDERGDRTGPKRNFIALLGSVDTPLVAFCDQDDVWEADKLSIQVEAIASAEARLGKEAPILCCSDARIVDARLGTIAESFFDVHGLITQNRGPLILGRLVFSNIAIGATTVINRALAQKCLDVPDAAIMHDWWAALIAAALGEIIVIPRSLIQYRQHGDNAVGAGVAGTKRGSNGIRARVEKARSQFVSSVLQVAEFQRCFGSVLPDSAKSAINQIAGLPSRTAFQRVTTLIRNDALRPRALQNALHIYLAATSDLKQVPAPTAKERL